MFDPELKITAVLIAIHWIPLLFAAWVWPLKKLDLSISSALALVFSILAWMIVLISLFLFFDVKANGRPMTWFAAYLIYSMMTLGVVPLILILIHVFAGRLAGYWMRAGQRKRQASSVSKAGTSFPGP